MKPCIVECFEPGRKTMYGVMNADGYTVALGEHRSSMEKVLARVLKGDSRFAF